MVAPNQPEKDGGQGGPVCLSDNTSGLRLIERATRERWPIPDHYRESIVERQIKIAVDPESSDRAATVAARCLATMEKQNMDAERLHLEIIGALKSHVELDATVVHQGGIDVRMGVSQLLESQDYAEFIRHRAAAGDTDAGLVCQIREPAHGQPVENGKALGPAGPGTNGHHNGSE